MLDFPGGSAVKNPPAMHESSSTPGSGRATGRGNGKPLQYSCQEKSYEHGSLVFLTAHESDVNEQIFHFQVLDKP